MQGLRLGLWTQTESSPKRLGSETCELLGRPSAEGESQVLKMATRAHVKRRLAVFPIKCKKAELGWAQSFPKARAGTITAFRGLSQSV